MTVLAGFYTQMMLGPAVGGDSLVAQPGLGVRVLDRDTGLAVALWADKEKTLPLANPVPTGVALGACGLDVAGNLSFFADPGSAYELEVSDEENVYPAVPAAGIPVDPAEPLAGTDQSDQLERSLLTDWAFISGRPTIDAGARYFGPRVGGAVTAQSVRNAIEAATDAKAAGRGGDVFFSPGRYRMDSFAPGGTLFCPLTTGLRLHGQPGAAIIEVDPGIVAWRTVFGTEAHDDDFDLSGLDVYGLIFDGLSDLNPSTAINAGQTRYMVSAYRGSRMRVRWCLFRNQTGRNIVSIVAFGVTNEISHVVYEHNWHLNIGTLGQWHDTSAVYLDGSEVRHLHNVYEGKVHANGEVTSAYAPYEIHGENQLSLDTQVRNFLSAGLLVGPRVGGIGGKPESIVSRGLVAKNVGSGLGIYPINDLAVACADVVVDGADITINGDQWPNDPVVTAAGVYPGCGKIGISASFTAVPVKRWRFNDIRVRWLAQVAQPYRVTDNLLRFDHPLRTPSAKEDIEITNVLAIDCPSSVVRFEQLYSLAGLRLRNVVARNLGKAQLGRRGQALLSIGPQVWQGQRPTGLAGLQVDEVTVVDDQPAHTALAVLSVDDPLVRVAAATTSLATPNVVTVVGTLHDLGSIIAHPDLPVGTKLSGVSLYADAQAFNVLAFAIDTLATGASTAAATITSQPPTIDSRSARITNPAVRLADGAVIPLAHLPVAGQGVYLDARTRFAPVGGAGGAAVGSVIVDEATGLTNSQIKGPVGNTWTTGVVAEAANGYRYKLEPPNALWVPIAFDPAEVAQPMAFGYEPWLLADGPVAQVPDRSGNARHLVQPVGAAQPLNAVAIDGRSALLFDGVNDWMEAPGFILAQPATEIIVRQVASAAGAVCTVDGRLATGRNLLYHSGGQMRAHAGVDFLLGAPAITWQIIVIEWNGAATKVRINGGAGGVGNAGAAARHGLLVGCNTVFAQFFAGSILAIYRYQGIVSPADLNRLVNQHLKLLAPSLPWADAV